VVSAIGIALWRGLTMIITRFEAMQATQNETNKATNEALLKVALAMNTHSETSEQVVKAVDKLDRRLEHVEKEFISVRDRVKDHEKAITGQHSHIRMQDSRAVVRPMTA
jgi:hypothetical protein